jgi:phospho-N-acetylmuramoyl-pentapeptide-transferase
MFVVNTLSVVIQVGYFKLTKKRVFKMAPLHHHFERCGISETRIVFSYIVITIVGVAVAMLIYL